jgi:hypothetical protein
MKSHKAASIFKDLLGQNINNALPQNIADDILEDLVAEAIVMSKDQSPEKSGHEPVIIPTVLYLCLKTGRNVTEDAIELEENELLRLTNIYCFRLHIEKYRRMNSFNIVFPSIETIFDQNGADLFKVMFDKTGREIIDIIDAYKTSAN